MIPISAVLILLFTHWVADFVFQSHDMATKKSFSNSWLTAHILVYTTTLWVVSMFAFGDPHINDHFIAASQFAAINGAAHFFTDYVTSKATSYLHKEERTHEFFVMIGLDQFLHAAVLVLSYGYVFT